jgi:hypothetical protein
MNLSLDYVIFGKRFDDEMLDEYSEQIKHELSANGRLGQP